MDSLPKRIRDKIVFTPCPIPGLRGDCWTWTAGRNTNGYASIRWGKYCHGAHRIVFTLLRCKVPKELELDHLCRVRHCVNPDHLEIVTSQVNNLRGFGCSGKNARKQSCANGHPFTNKNTYIRPSDGGRRCRICIARGTMRWINSHREQYREYDNEAHKRRRQEKRMVSASNTD